MQKFAATLMVLLAACCGLACAADYNQVAVFGKCNAKFEPYGLSTTAFEDKDALAAMQGDTPLRVCEALDNSLLAVFAEQTKPEVFKAIFGNAASANSLQELLRRGGTVYIGPTSWDILNSLPAEMKAFCKANGIVLITTANYKSETPEQVYTGVAAPQFAGALAGKPNKLDDTFKDAQAVRYFDALPAEFKPVLVDGKSGKPVLVMQEGVAGKGRIIWSFCHTLLRTEKNKFMENLASELYGERKQLSAREAIQNKLGLKSDAPQVQAQAQAQAQPALPAYFPTRAPALVKVDGAPGAEWEKAPQAQLLVSKDGGAPQRAGSARVQYDDKFLYVLFACRTPDTGKLKTAQTVRDAALWEGECVELFLREEGQGKAQYQFIVSAAGAVYDSRDGDAAWDCAGFSAAVSKTNDTWTAELAVPFAALGIDPAKAKFLRANFCRGAKDAELAQGELSSWGKAPNGFADPGSHGCLSFVPEKELAQVAQPAQPETAGKSLYAGGYLAWTDSFYKMKLADSMPEKLDELKSLSFTVLRNEKECAAVFVTNFADKALTLRVEPDFYFADGKTRFSEMFAFKQGVPRLNPYRQRQFDPLVKLNEGNLLAIAPYETAMLWLETKTELPAGSYKWGFAFVPVDNEWKEKRIEVAASVLPHRLPDRMPFAVYSFGPYGMSFARGDTLKENYLKAGAEIHLNWFYNTFPLDALEKQGDAIVVSADPAKYDRNEALFAKYGNWIYGYGVQAEFNARLKALGMELPQAVKGEKGNEAGAVVPELPERDRLFREWFARWMKSLADRGHGCDRFLIPLCDEVNAGAAPDVLRLGKIIKEIEPRARVYENPATWTTLDTIKLLDPVVDVWMPWEERLTGRAAAAEELAFYKSTGKPLWTYLCSINVQALSPLGYYRQRGLRSFALGAEGVALWSFNTWKGNDWNNFDQTDRQGGDNCIFYHADSGPVPSIRAEAFREGIEDMYLLREAQKLAAGNPALGALVEQKRLEALRKSAAPEKIQAWRDELAKALPGN